MINVNVVAQVSKVARGPLEYLVDHSAAQYKCYLVAFETPRYINEYIMDYRYYYIPLVFII